MKAVKDQIGVKGRPLWAGTSEMEGRKKHIPLPCN